MALPGETHRTGAALFANIYRDPRAAALYDVALYEATQRESAFFRDTIREGHNYTPLTVVGIGGVYGTIFSAAVLKTTPDNPAFGFDAGKRRGGLWTVSGDVTLDKPWWRMNSRNRPEDRDKLPLPGTEGNLNSLGTEIQPLQIPDISSAQYPTNAEFGRVLSHDNFVANHAVVNARLVKVRRNLDPAQRGTFQQEYEDLLANERFFVYSDVIVQATGLGREDYGFSSQYSQSKDVIDESKAVLEAGVETPRLLTFLQLVEATTSNRESVIHDFKRFGLIGKGDTSKVIREYFIGVGGIDPGTPAQEGFVEEMTVFGLDDKRREELAQSERARYILGLLEIERTSGGFYRVKPIEGRVLGVGTPRTGEGIAVYYEQKVRTPQGVIPIFPLTEIVPRLITAAGFEDESERIYAGLRPVVLEGERAIAERWEEVLAKPGSTIYFRAGSSACVLREIARMDIEETFADRGRVEVRVALVGVDGSVRRLWVDRVAPGDYGDLLDSRSAERVELASDRLNFQEFRAPAFHPNLPDQRVAEKLESFEIYRIGACTDLSISDEERGKAPALKTVPENSKSVFRFVRRTIAFAEALAKQIPRVDGALNLLQSSDIPLARQAGSAEATKESFLVEVDPRNVAQSLPPNINAGLLLRYHALSGLSGALPEDSRRLRVVVRRVPAGLGAVPRQFEVRCEQALLEPVWWGIAQEFVGSALVQRAVLQLTRNAAGALELQIDAERGRVALTGIDAQPIEYA